MFNGQIIPTLIFEVLPGLMCLLAFYQAVTQLKGLNRQGVVLGLAALVLAVAFYYVDRPIVLMSVGIGSMMLMMTIANMQDEIAKLREQLGAGDTKVPTTHESKALASS